MKPFIVLLLVAAAAGSLFLALNKDAPGPAQDDPGRVTYEESENDAADAQADEVPDLSPVGTGENRENVAPEVANTVNGADATPMATLAGYGDLSGRVTDAGGAALPGAQVTLTMFGSQSFNFFEDVDRSKDVTTGTDEEGRFMFRRVPVREGYSLIATHPDFSRTELPGVFVRDGEVTESADIVMGKGRALRGRITDASGSPVPGARLVLNQDMFGASLDGGSNVDQLETSSDDQGGYEFANVAPQQNYALTVVAEGYGKVILPTIAVLETEDTVKDIVLEVASLLAGQVISVNGEPIEGVSVEAWATDQTKRNVHTKAKSLEDGSFEFTDVPPGRYQLVARHPMFAANARERAEAGDVNVTITLEQLPVISGKLVDASTGAPIPQGIVQLRAAIVGSQNGQTQGLKNTRVQVNDAEGRFTIVSPKAGSYLVEGKVSGFADTYSETFETVMGQDTTGIMVRMTRGGTIVGRVLDDAGQPIPGAVVESHDEVWSDDAFMRVLGDIGDGSEKSARTGADGTFKLAGLTPANYQLLVRHKDFAQEKITGLVVTEGQETRTSDAILPRGGIVSGVVYGPGGTPVAGAQVKMFPTTPSGRTHTVITEANGSFEVRSVREGGYKIHATRRRNAGDNPFMENLDLKDTQREVNVRNGQTLGGQEFRLKDH